MLSCGTGLPFTIISSPLSQDVLDVQYLSQLTDNIRDHEAFVPVIQYKKGDTLCCIQINSYYYHCMTRTASCTEIEKHLTKNRV